MSVYIYFYTGIYNGPDRAALCACPKDIDQGYSNEECLIGCSNVDGRGLNFFDIRVSKLTKTLPNVSRENTDIIFTETTLHGLYIAK